MRERERVERHVREKGARVREQDRERKGERRRICERKGSERVRKNPFHVREVPFFFW